MTSVETSLGPRLRGDANLRCHSRAGGNPVPCRRESLGPRLRGDDRIVSTRAEPALEVQQSGAEIQSKIVGGVNHAEQPEAVTPRHIEVDDEHGRGHDGRWIHDRCAQHLRAAGDRGARTLRISQPADLRQSVRGVSESLRRQRQNRVRNGRRRPAGDRRDRRQQHGYLQHRLEPDGRRLRAGREDVDGIRREVHHRQRVPRGS